MKFELAPSGGKLGFHPLTPDNGELWVRRELAYPDEWLRGWERVLLRWPGAKDAVPLTIEPGQVCLGGGDDVLQGAYDWKAHAIFLFPDDDRAEALATLVHEYAHAWSPHVRGNHHPAVWREAYLSLIHHLTGLQLREDRVYADVREIGRQYPDLKVRRRGDSWKARALDIAATATINQLARLRIDRVDGPRGYSIRATCGARVHLIDVPEQHATP